MSEDKKIKIYSTPACAYCNMAKAYFKENNVSFEDYNVAVDSAKRMEMVEKTRQMGVPVIDIDGQIIIGFDKSAIDNILGLNK